LGRKEPLGWEIKKEGGRFPRGGNQGIIPFFTKFFGGKAVGLAHWGIIGRPSYSLKEAYY